MLDRSLAAVLKLNAVSSANLNIMYIIYRVLCVSLVIQNGPNYATRLYVGNILPSVLYFHNFIFLHLFHKKIHESLRGEMKKDSASHWTLNKLRIMCWFNINTRASNLMWNTLKISCEIHLKFYHEAQFSVQFQVVHPGSQNIIQGMDSVLMLKNICIS